METVNLDHARAQFINTREPIAWLVSFVQLRALYMMVRDHRDVISVSFPATVAPGKVELFGLPVYASDHHEGPPLCVRA